jgi:hypothetical protein
MRLKVALLTAVSCVGIALPASADSTRARCEYYHKGEDRVEVWMPCTFSQRQGNVSIQWEDGVRNEFRLTDANTYVDQRGGKVYRDNKGLGEIGTIFRMEQGSIFVYWK